MARDANYNKMIQSKQWQSLRRKKLSAQPLCEDCKEAGIYTPASEVHHVRPCERSNSVQEMHKLMFDYNNLASLCHDCHVLRHKQLASHTGAQRAENEKQKTDRFINRYLK